MPARPLLLLLCLLAGVAGSVPAPAQTPPRLINPPTGPQIDARKLPVLRALGPQMELLKAFDRNEAQSSNGPFPLATRLYVGRPFDISLAFRNLPEGTLRVELDRSRYPADGVSQFNPSTNRILSTTEEKRNVSMVVREGAVPPDGVVKLHLLALVDRPDGRRETFAFDHAYVIMTRMRRETWTRTGEMAEMFSLQPSFGPSPSVCEGESWTPAGTYPVGKSVRNGKVVFTIRSGPLGTWCNWISRTTQTPALDYPSKVVAITWSARASDQCTKPKPDFDLDPPPMGMDQRTDWVQVGNGRQVVANLRNLTGSRLPVMLLAMRCNNTLLNDHFLEVTWDSVEVEVPEGRPWSWGR